MIDCHVHLWDPAAGFPWIRPGSEHHHTFGEGDLERSGAGLGLAGAVLVEASRGDAGETMALSELRRRRRTWSPGTWRTCTSTEPPGPTGSAPSWPTWVTSARTG